MKVPLLLRCKAEIVIGVLLVVRNSTLRLACLLSLVVVALSLMDHLGRTPRDNHQTTVFLIAGTLAAVVGSRLLAPGGALAASRQVAARFWLVPFGRLTGGVLVVLPVVAVAALSLRTAEVSPFQFSLTAVVYSAAVASTVLALAPATGGSAAALVGLVAVWGGGVPPADVHAMLERWPLLQRIMVFIWHLLPLQWRAGRLLDGLNWMDALVLIGWTVIGVAFAGWVTKPVWSIDRWFRGGVWQR